MKEKIQNRVLSFIGPPGSGKGTIAQQVSDIYGIPQISPGDLFRDHMARKTELGKRIAKSMDEGVLVDDDTTIQMVAERISKKDCEDGFILDGFPRTIYQAKHLVNFMKIDKVVNFVVSRETIIERLTQRRICSKCRRIYHLTNIPPKKEGVCDKCGGKLIYREDDKPEAIKNRLEIYHKETEPLIKFLRDAGVLVDLDAEGTVESIMPDVKKIIESE